MYIYKITNSINNKVYIGQSINPIKDRFHRHLNDAEKLDTHFARAIRKYGKDNFYIEQIDEATNQEELNQKEHYWINYYDAINAGYNETDSILKSGGNTYLSKTKEEMDIIKEKIRQTKLGGKNPNAEKIKAKNIETNEELVFDSMADCRNYFNEKSHQFASRRCRFETKCLYKDKWAFAYFDQEYNNFTKGIKNRGNQIEVTNLFNNEVFIFNSYTEAAEKLGLNRKNISKKMNEVENKVIEYNGYKIKLLK